MPRIAASLAVFLTVVTCIGYNTARYPVVWEMVTLPDGFAQAHLPARSATDPPSADTSSSEDAAPSWKSGNSPAEETPSWGAAAETSPERHGPDRGPHSSDDYATAQSEPGSYDDQYASYSGENSYPESGEAFSEGFGSAADYPSRGSDEGSYGDVSSYGSPTGYENDGAPAYGAPDAYGDAPSYAGGEDWGADPHDRGGYDGVAGADARFAASDEGCAGGQDKDAAEKEPVGRVAMRSRAEAVASEPAASSADDSVDPVAPLRPSQEGGASALGKHDGPAGTRVDAAEPYSSGAGHGASLDDDSAESTSQARLASSRREEISAQSVAPSSPKGAGPYKAYGSSGATSAPGDAPAAQPTGDPVSGDELVPIRPAGAASSEPEQADAPATGETGDAPLTRQVRRLPPVDEVATLPGAEAPPTDREPPITAYPPAGGE